MRYYLNTQHDGPAGDLISLALVREDGRSLYIVLPHDHHSEKPGVQDMLAVLKNTPESPIWPRDRQVAARGVREFLVPGHTVIGHGDCLVALVALLHQDDPGGNLRIEQDDTEVAARVIGNAWWEAVALAEKLGAELGG